jgi:hypothetical protein
VGWSAPKIQWAVSDRPEPTRPPISAWDPLAGVYKAANGRFVRLHTNFAHHRQAVLDVLRCEATREAVQAALLGWDAEEFETAAYAAGGWSPRCARRPNGRAA